MSFLAWLKGKGAGRWRAPPAAMWSRKNRRLFEDQGGDDHDGDAADQRKIGQHAGLADAEVAPLEAEVLEHLVGELPLVLEVMAEGEDRDDERDDDDPGDQ